MNPSIPRPVSPADVPSTPRESIDITHLIPAV